MKIMSIVLLFWRNPLLDSGTTFLDRGGESIGQNLGEDFPSGGQEGDTTVVSTVSQFALSPS